VTDRFTFEVTGLFGRPVPTSDTNVSK